MNFDKKKRLKLIKEAKELNKQNKSILVYAKIMSTQLYDYLILVSDNVYWQNQAKYLQLVEAFVNKNITMDKFSEQYKKLFISDKKLEREYLDNLESTINLKLSSKCLGFSTILSELDMVIEEFDPNAESTSPDDLYGNYGRNEESSRLYIKKYSVPQLHKYCKNS